MTKHKPPKLPPELRVIIKRHPRWVATLTNANRWRLTETTTGTVLSVPSLVGWSQVRNLEAQMRRVEAAS